MSCWWLNTTPDRLREGRRKKEEGRRKKEEGRRKKEEGRRKKEEGRRRKEEENLSLLRSFSLFTSPPLLFTSI
jgi:hypothetical protein